MNYTKLVSLIAFVHIQQTDAQWIILITFVRIHTIVIQLHLLSTNPIILSQHGQTKLIYPILISLIMSGIYSYMQF